MPDSQTPLRKARRFHIGYLLAGLILAVVLFAGSLVIFPEWGRSYGWLLALLVFIAGGVVNFLADWRTAFENKSTGETTPRTEPAPSVQVQGDISAGSDVVFGNKSVAGHDIVSRDKFEVHYHAGDRDLELTGSRLPPRNPLFVGRTKPLAQLAERLNADGALVVLTGAGGMGKTQTAIEFGHAYAAQFPGGVFWLRCDNLDLITSEVAACGDKGRIARAGYDELPQPDKVNLVLAAWQQPVARLLLFDNAEDPAILKDWRPTTGGCRLLVTARRHNWPPALTSHVFALPTLDRADSRKLLAYGDQAREKTFAADEAADQIADLLGGYDPSISADGRWVTFWSSATNLTSDARAGVFVRDLATGTMEWIEGGSPRISADGRWVVFVSGALSVDDTNELPDIYVYDLETGKTERVSVPGLR